MAFSGVIDPIGAKEIGTFFIQQYYEILKKEPQYACRFYNEGSHLVVADRLDSGSTETATSLKSISDILMSLDFEKVEIESIISEDSWSGGIIVVLSGFMDSKADLKGVVRKKFMQTIFLAPQNKGYFVESDIVRYLEVGVIEDEPSEGSQLSVEDEREPEKALESEAIEHLHSDHLVEEAHCDSDPNFHKHDPETLKEEAPLEVSSATQHSDRHLAQKSLAVVEEPVAEPTKFSYASIVLKGVPKEAASIQPSYVKKAPPPIAQQPRPASVASRPESVASDRAEGISGRSLSQGESVYVKNLPPGISKHEVFEEFRQFGRIKQDGVFVKTSSDSGFCFGFVDFEDSESAQNAVKASPLKLDGRPVYIEFKKAGTSPSGPPPRGGRGGGGGRDRGRGGRGNTDGRRY